MISFLLWFVLPGLILVACYFVVLGDMFRRSIFWGAMGVLIPVIVPFYGLFFYRGRRGGLVALFILVLLFSITSLFTWPKFIDFQLREWKKTAATDYNLHCEAYSQFVVQDTTVVQEILCEDRNPVGVGKDSVDPRQFPSKFLDETRKHFGGKHMRFWVQVRDDSGFATCHLFDEKGELLQSGPAPLSPEPSCLERSFDPQPSDVI